MNKNIIKFETEIINMIFTFRGQKVMIDRDLAKLYGIQTKRLNEQVKRNIKRFEGYLFSLNNKEINELVANCDRFDSLKYSVSNPIAFNEYGILMLSSILNSDLAIEINRKIIKVFVEIRNQISAIPEYALLREQMRRIEAEQESLKMTQIIDNKLLTDKVTKLSSEVFQFSQILDEFQGNHLIIKRPVEGEKNG